MISLKKTFAACGLLFFTVHLYAQDDMLKLLDSVETPGKKYRSERTIATFKGSKIIDVQTTETVKKGTMDFNITHNFGNIGEESGGGVHSLYGLDAINDVRFGFDFGITTDLTIGVGRSKQKELIDGFVKYRIANQTTNNHIPFSLAVYGDMSYSPMDAAVFYAGGQPEKQNDLHRFSYVGQLIIARKFNWRFSAELLPTFQHRNYIVEYLNPGNNAMETNDLFSLGAGVRLKLTQRFAIIADYYYLFSKYRQNNDATAYYNPLGIGFEIDTGGHIFHITFTNASGIIENNYLPNTTDNWLKGGFKFGFNISRVFNLGGKRNWSK
ncbi:MAG TPA: DUF5777 family beta-barrel protein [Bacteroidia bacterium]|nr:DUF5777 family beta-barrel protein [Bacteroidia bacterium]